MVISQEAFSALQEQVQTLQAVFQKQQEQIHQQGEKIIDLEKRVQEVEAENVELKQHSETHILEDKEENQELKRQSKFRKTSLQKRASGNGAAIHNIGFTASLSTVTALGDGQIIVFDTIISNDGNGYDSRHGHFTAPITGLYAFSVTVMCYGNESELHVNILKDGQNIGVAFANGNHYDNGSKLVVVQLQAGQMVWVQHAIDPSGYKIHVSGNGAGFHNIGFTASLSTVTALGNGQIIVFDTIISNDGNGYDSRYGHFTAPITGLYAFSVTVMCYGSESELHVNILKDGQNIGVAFANGNHYDNGSKFVVVQLQAGQVVWVEHANEPSGYKIHGQGYSSFSGFLIQSY
ncbi:uncharacterized protein LOC132560598 [Ylistrum balloti]|uniref:uncharacterized protein LOC132560598 n=1 Tax=Ylistrum balloti TaxID=509963 RepID=UPI0029058AD5|nr:uncharacterized protein LOC132560598 [Ylistrum balloti]